VDAPLVTVRALHIGACMLAAGELAFALLVARRDVAPRVPGLARRLRISTACAWLIALASGTAWVALEASRMSGAPIANALVDGTLGVVLRQTSFGRVFALRALVLIALGVVLAWLAVARGGRARHALRLDALALASAALVSLALVGHAAAAGPGAIHVAHAVADVLHLAAAGAWLGALPALAFCLARPLPVADLARLTLRFSTLGVACVALVVATGVVNAVFLVGSWPALFTSAYGRMLLAKLAIFAIMLALAAVNRQRWTPRLAGGDAVAARRLRRNAMLEIAGGLAVIAIVGALGTMVPANEAAHAMHGG
jgi:putative copper resistance protein D